MPQQFGSHLGVFEHLLNNRHCYQLGQMEYDRAPMGLCSQVPTQGEIMIWTGTIMYPSCCRKKALLLFPEVHSSVYRQLSQRQGQVFTWTLSFLSPPC